MLKLLITKILPVYKYLIIIASFSQNHLQTMTSSLHIMTSSYMMSHILMWSIVTLIFSSADYVPLASASVSCEQLPCQVKQE